MDSGIFGACIIAAAAVHITDSMVSDEAIARTMALAERLYLAAPKHVSQTWNAKELYA